MATTKKLKAKPEPKAKSAKAKAKPVGTTKPVSKTKRVFAIYAPLESQLKPLVAHLKYLSSYHPDAKVFLCPRELWKNIDVMTDDMDLRSYLGKSKDCKYEDGHLVSFARSIWKSTHIVIFDDGSKTTKEVIEMSKRMNCIRNLKIIQP